MTTGKKPAFNVIERAFHDPLEILASGWTASDFRDTRGGPQGIPGGALQAFLKAG